MSEHLNVMYAADNNYAPFLGVSLLSLYENNKDIDEITVYAVLDDVSDENTEKIVKMSEEYKRDLRVVDGKAVREKMQELGVPKYRGSYATHYRKFFEMIVDEDIDRLLYVDCDTIICDNLKKLLEIDMGEACVGVVRDSLGNKYKRLFGFDDDETYFNAGVTLINVKNWNKYDCHKLLIDHIKNERAKYCNPDQDLFNLSLRGKTMVLPVEYNFPPVHRAYPDKAFDKCYGFKNFYTKEEVEYARQHPAILHTYRFIGDFPWHKGNVHPDNDLFDHYLSMSPWKGYEKKSSNKGFVYKVEKVMFKVLPRGLFLRIFSVVTYYMFKDKDKKLRRA